MSAENINKKPKMGLNYKSTNPSKDNFYNKANKAFIEKNYHKALEFCNQALRSDSSNIQIYNLRGMTYEKLGNISEACKDFHYVLGKEPQNADAHDNLGNILYDLDSYDKALYHYFMATYIDENHQEAFFHAGKTLVMLGKDEEARAYFEQALLLDETLEDIIQEFCDNTLEEAYDPVMESLGDTIYDSDSDW